MIRVLMIWKVKDVIGEDEYQDLVRFLSRIEQTDWDEVPPWKNKRMGVVLGDDVGEGSR